MNTTFQTSFVVYPEHTNSLQPLIFGGAFFSEMDKAAAITVHRLLYASVTCKSAVTHKVENLTFYKPCYMGDLININCKVESVGKKSVVVQVECYRELREQYIDLVAEAKFIFVTLERVDTIVEKFEWLPYAQHGLTL